MRNTDYENVYIARREYDDNNVGYKLRTENGEYVGTLSDINNNRTNNGEQIFTYTKTSSGRDSISPDAPLSKRAEVKEITILYRGSTNPLGIFTGETGEVGKDWGLNNTVLGLKMLTEQKALSKR